MYQETHVADKNQSNNCNIQINYEKKNFLTLVTDTASLYKRCTFQRASVRQSQVLLNRRITFSEVNVFLYNRKIEDINFLMLFLKNFLSIRSYVVNTVRQTAEICKHILYKILLCYSNNLNINGRNQNNDWVIAYWIHLVIVDDNTFNANNMVIVDRNRKVIPFILLPILQQLFLCTASLLCLLFAVHLKVQ